MPGIGRQAHFFCAVYKAVTNKCYLASKFFSYGIIGLRIEM
jgi:hypothetical protein